jgi:hypothetical protein
MRMVRSVPSHTIPPKSETLSNHLRVMLSICQLWPAFRIDRRPIRHHHCPPGKTSRRFSQVSRGEDIGTPGIKLTSFEQARIVYVFRAFSGTVGPH